MANLSDLVPDVRVEIPEIPRFAAERQLLRAIRQFAEETRAWRVDVLVSTTANISTVNLTTLLPAGTQLVDIISVKNSSGGRPVIPTTFSKLDTNHTDWRTDVDLNAKWYVLNSNNVIRFIPTPSTTVASKYYVRVAVKPLLTATVIGDMLVNKYDELLVHGALSKLYAMPRKPWTDNNLAAYHVGLFMSGFPAARTEAAEEFQTGVPRKVKYGGL